MTLTNLQRIKFFSSNVQIGLKVDQRISLSNKVLVNETDFIDFQNDKLKTDFKNMHSGVPVITGVTAITEQFNNTCTLFISTIPNIVAITAIRATPIPAKCVSRLLTASIAYNYYVETGHATTQNNMHFQSTLRSFKTEWTAIVTISKLDSPKFPAIFKTNPPLQWCKSFKNVSYNTFGVRGVPLPYAIRDVENVTPQIDYTCLADQAHGASGSVIEELILRTAHDDRLYK